MSEQGNETDNDADAELGKSIEKKITDSQHIEGGIVGQCQVMFKRNKVRDAHDDQRDEDQREGTLRAKQDREEDQDICEAKIDRRHRDRIQSPEERELAVGEA